MRHSGFTCEHAHHTRHRYVQNADRFAHTSTFSVLFTEVVCNLGMTPLRTAISQVPDGGMTPSKAPTRRRHADATFRMAQTPTATGIENARGTEDPAAVPMSSARGCHSPATAHTEGATVNQISPNKNYAPPLRYKTLPAHPFPPHVRYKTLPAHPKWLNLALFLHAGRVLYRSHHQEAKQGEFCTEREAEMGLANTTGHQAPPVWRAPEGAEGLAAAPMDNGFRPR